MSKHDSGFTIGHKVKSYVFWIRLKHPFYLAKREQEKKKKKKENAFSLQKLHV